jgi:hypothetical protein
MCSTVPAERADDALLNGDGKMWVEVYGNPFAEQVVFHQERILQPWKSHPLEAPKIASHSVTLHLKIRNQDRSSWIRRVRQ